MNKHIPELLPGEDRNFGNGLFVDLVPAGSWYQNVRAVVTDRQWGYVRDMVRKRAGHCCEVCGACSGDRLKDPGGYRTLRLETHERWGFNMDAHTQTLRRLICLCSACHETTHLGLATTRGFGVRAKAHLARVNQWKPERVAIHVHKAYTEWNLRSEVEWDIDISIINNLPDLSQTKRFKMLA